MPSLTHYLNLLDAYAALPAGERWGLSLRGNAAGVALRQWATVRRIDVVPDTCDGERSTWTVLRAELPGDAFATITVALDDEIPVAGAAVPSIAELAEEVGIPF